MMEPGVAPAACVSQTPPRDASGHRPLYYEGCLQWLDVDGLKGGANAAWIGAR